MSHAEHEHLASKRLIVSLKSNRLPWNLVRVVISCYNCRPSLAKKYLWTTLYEGREASTSKILMFQPDILKKCSFFFSKRHVRFYLQYFARIKVRKTWFKLFYACVIPSYSVTSLIIVEWLLGPGRCFGLKSQKKISFLALGQSSFISGYFMKNSIIWN